MAFQSVPGFSHGVADGEVGDPGAVRVAVDVVGGGVDVAFQVDDVVAHGHAWQHRRHFDADEVVGDDFHVVLVDRAADEELVRGGGGGSQKGSRGDDRLARS